MMVLALSFPMLLFPIPLSLLPVFPVLPSLAPVFPVLMFPALSFPGLPGLSLAPAFPAMLTYLNAKLETGGFKSDVKVTGIRPREKNITITVMADYRYGERLQDLIKMITNYIDMMYPGTNVDVNANGCWTKVAIVVQSNEKGTYVAVRLQLKNLAYPKN